MRTDLLRDRFGEILMLLAWLVVASLLAQPMIAFGQEGTPVSQAEPPVVEEVPSVEEVAPSEEPAPTDEPLPTDEPQPTDEPAPIDDSGVDGGGVTGPATIEAPTKTPPVEATEVPTAMPTAVPAPAATCEREGVDLPVVAGQVVEYHCQYTNGPLKPVIVTLPAGWEYSLTGEAETYQTRLDIDLPVYDATSGEIRLFFRAGDSAVLGTDNVTIEFRASDFSVEAAKSEIRLPVTLVAPTVEAPIPFEPVLECTPLESAIAGATDWAYQDCAVSWQTKNVSGVELTVASLAEGWSVIATDQQLAEDAEGASSVTLADDNPDDGGFYSAHVLIGTRLDCDTDLTAAIDVQMTSVSRAPVPTDAAGNALADLASQPEVQEIVQRSLSATAIMPDAPEVTITAGSFTSIDLLSGDQTSTGTFTFAYTGAPEGCGWQMTVRLGDLVNGDVTIPAANLEYDSIDGLDASVTSPGAGTFVVQPSRSETATSGTFTLTTTLDLQGFVPQGMYETTVGIDVTMEP